MRLAAIVVLCGACGSSGGGGTPDPCIAANTCPPGVWIDVTPPDMDPGILSPTENAFGPGSVVADPARPNEMYIGGGDDGIWKSTDYGNTWTRINSDLPGVAHGNTIAVAGTTPATLWVAAGANTGQVYKSTDAGASFTLIGTGGLGSDLYSLEVDPADADHLLSGLHEADGIVESTDGGATWNLVGGTGFPGGGVSWYPFFITSTRWIAIAQNGASVVLTDDSGASWRVPAGIDGLQHPHGNAQIYQDGDTIFVGGVAGPGQGVYRSTDRGDTFTQVMADLPIGVVWGTPTSVYAMWGWACSNCDLGDVFTLAPQPGTQWTTQLVPTDLVIGASHVAVADTGANRVFVGVMWAAGVWRYVEP